MRDAETAGLGHGPTTATIRLPKTLIGLAKAEAMRRTIEEGRPVSAAEVAAEVMRAGFAARGIMAERGAA